MSTGGLEGRRRRGPERAALGAQPDPKSSPFRDLGSMYVGCIGVPRLVCNTARMLTYLFGSNVDCWCVWEKLLKSGLATKIATTHGTLLIGALVFQFLVATMKENSNLILQKVTQVHYEAHYPPTITTGKSMLCVTVDSRT